MSFYVYRHNIITNYCSYFCSLIFQTTLTREMCEDKETRGHTSQANTTGFGMGEENKRENSSDTNKDQEGKFYTLAVVLDDIFLPSNETADINLSPFRNPNLVKTPPPHIEGKVRSLNAPRFRKTEPILPVTKASTGSKKGGLHIGGKPSTRGMDVSFYLTGSYLLTNISLNFT